MGQRANLITVENGEYTLRYDHWCANRLDEILFWGAGYALDYIEAQEALGEESWLDEVWAEGGAVLDLDKKHLLWWGGEDIRFEVNPRRVYLKMQQKVWADWTIEWAHRGIVDLAEYVGYPKEKVLADNKNSNEPVELKIPDEKNWINILGSIKFADETIKVFPLSDNTENYLRNGAELINQCRSGNGVENLTWAEWTEQEDFPQGGFWIDEKSRAVEFWDARDCPNTVQDLKNIWEDWEIIWYQDKYEFQIEKLGDRIVLPEFNEAESIKSWRENLLREDGKSGVDFALDVTETLKNEGKNVGINPWLFKSHQVKQPLETKLEIWRKNFGE